MDSRCLNQLVRQDPRYRQERNEKDIYKKEADQARRLKKRLRQWIKKENIDIPDDIRKMIGYL